MRRVLHWMSSISALLEHPFWGCLNGAIGSVDVWCSARRSCRGRGFESRSRQKFTASIGSVDSLYPSLSIYKPYKNKEKNMARYKKNMARLCYNNR